MSAICASVENYSGSHKKNRGLIGLECGIPAKDFHNTARLGPGRDLTRRDRLFRKGCNMENHEGPRRALSGQDSQNI